MRIAISGEIPRSIWAEPEAAMRLISLVWDWQSKQVWNRKSRSDTLEPFLVTITDFVHHGVEFLEYTAAKAVADTGKEVAYVEAPNDSYTRAEKESFVARVWTYRSKPDRENLTGKSVR